MSLIAQWSLNDGSGNTASDISGNSHDGTLQGNASWVASGLGGAVSFDGTDSYISVPDHPSLRITGDLSIAFWLKKNAEAADWVRLVGKGTQDYRTYGVWAEYSGQRILFQQYDADYRYQLQLYSQAELDVGTWYHVACVAEDTAARIYIDGALDSTGQRSGTPYSTTEPLTIGYGIFDFLNGEMDDVRLYDHALTGSEVSSIYALGTP